MYSKVNLSSLVVALVFSFSYLTVLAQPLPSYALESENSSISRVEISKEVNKPPVQPVRTMAEWEEVDALMVSWQGFYPILREIIKFAKEEAEVIIVSSDSNSVKSNLSSNGINFDNLNFVEAASNSVWIRDYGPWSVYRDGVDSLLLIDWIYNRNRPWDDKVSSAISNNLNLPLYEMNDLASSLVHTGGNFMTDGFGTGFSSELVLDENWNGSFNLVNRTESGVDSLMKEFMGIDRFIKMPILPWDAIHHIDMHMKLIDEETILVGEYPAGIADGPQIEANIQYIQNNFNSVYGTPYRIIRMPMPADEFGDYPDNGGDYRTFVNSVFVNKTVIVPIYEEQYDTTALRIWREALPGYHIAGVNANDMIWAFGAIHCITKLVGSSDPLLISHQPIRTEQRSSSNYEIDAYIRHKSGISDAKVYYSVDTSQSFSYVQMTLTDPANFTWSAEIPAQSADDTVHYYIAASSNSGKSQYRPLPAPLANWKFKVVGDDVSAVAVNPSLEQTSMQALFPNPSKGITCIPIRTNLAVSGKLVLTDIFGKEISSIFEGNIQKGEQKFFINTTNTPSGVYLVKFEAEIANEGLIDIQKLVVK